MVDRSAHIDLFFRNGLKEFEVLPPADIWDDIKPVIGRKQQSFFILRIAAVSTILVSLGAVSFLLTRSLSDKFNGPAISFNQETIPEGTYVAKAEPAKAVLYKQSAVISNAGVSDDIYPAANNEEVRFNLPEIKLFNPSYRESYLQKNINDDSFIGPKMTQDNSSSPEPVNFIPENPGIIKSDNNGSKWSIGALASPTYYSRFNFGSDASKELTKSEKAALSYSGGIEFSYKVNRRISLQTGLYYSSLGQKVTGVSSFSGFRPYYDAKNGSDFIIQTSTGTITSYNNDIFLLDSKMGSRVLTRYTVNVFDPYKAELKYIDNSLLQNFSYLEVPLLLKYKVIDRKIDFNIIGGISYNILVSNSAYTYAEGIKYYIGKTEGLNVVTFSSSLGMGMEYSLSKRIFLNFEPTFRYYLTPVGNLTGSSIHPFSFGVLSGFLYKF